MLTMLFGCRTYVEDSTPQPVAILNQPATSPEGSPELEKSVTEFIKELPMVEQEERLGMLRAWTRVPNNDRYRLAQAREFTNRSMIYDYGELAGAYGLAALIVDKTLNADRFSLLIFDRRPANRFDVYWIYRNMDLSKHSMSRASGDIFVDEVREDGTKGVCEIQWDRKKRRWACTAP
jgi:hypothetical protein